MAQPDRDAIPLWTGLPRNELEKTLRTVAPQQGKEILSWSPHAMATFRPLLRMQSISISEPIDEFHHACTHNCFGTPAPFWDQFNESPGVKLPESLYRGQVGNQGISELSGSQ